MSREELADRYGELDRQVTLFQPTLDEHKAAKDRLIAMAEDEPADKAVEITGKLYVAQLGARKNERTVTDPRKAFTLLKKALGADGAIGAITIPLGAIDKVVPGSEQKSFVVKEQTGSRSVDVVALHPQAA